MSLVVVCQWDLRLSSIEAVSCLVPEREWRNWQTRQLEVLVGVKSRGGSSPLSRIDGIVGFPEVGKAQSGGGRFASGEQAWSRFLFQDDTPPDQRNFPFDPG